MPGAHPIARTCKRAFACRPRNLRSEGAKKLKLFSPKKSLQPTGTRAEKLGGFRYIPDRQKFAKQSNLELPGVTVI